MNKREVHGFSFYYEMHFFPQYYFSVKTYTAGIMQNVNFGVDAILWLFHVFPLRIKKLLMKIFLTPEVIPNYDTTLETN